MGEIDALLTHLKDAFFQNAEIRLHQRLRRGNIHAARKGNNDIFGTVPGCLIAENILARKTFDVVGRAENISAVILFPVKCRREHVEAKVVGSILVHRNFLADHALFADHLFVGKGTVQKEVGKNFEGLRRVIGRTFRVIAGHILSRKGVDLRADTVERVGNFKGGAFFCALELHMLDKMGNAVLGIRLPRRTRTDENPHRDGQQPLHLFYHQPKPVAVFLFVNHNLLSSVL